MQKLHCPHCSRELNKELFRKKVLFRCPDCGGQYLTVSALRGLCSSRELVNRVWRNAMHSQAEGTFCPECRSNMRQALLFPALDLSLELDVCLKCQSVWFDPSELESLPLNEIPEDKLSPEAKAAIAAYTIAYVKETAQYQNSPITGWSSGSPYDIWKMLPALLGLPVEQDFNALRSRPFLTWSAAAVCSLVFLLTFRDLTDVINAWGFIPQEMFRHMGATWITSMFLHGGWLHLLSNMYFLLTFGDNVEDEFGHGKYLLLILFFGFSAHLFHALFDLRSTIPCVGASGFISGILGCYAICFPKRQINIAIRKYFLASHWITLPAWSVFVLWIIFQMVWARISKLDPSSGGIAYFSHLGGAAAGIIAGIIFKLLQRKSSTSAFLQKLYSRVKSSEN